MPYRVDTKPSAAAQIRKLPRNIQERVLAKLRQLAENARPSGVQKLRGEEDLYRVRVGNYRIVYTISDDPPEVLVLGSG